MGKRRQSALIAAGGVALADILANSVAVILIMIIVTMSVQQERAEREITVNADVTTILARQLATTVVYNDLPSSPPARLHDYYSCQIPHDCQPELYPIIELHQNYIREYNSNLRFYRNELLRPQNPFDDLINTFSAEDRLNIRIDVYDVNLYYLAIGILKEHNIHPRHWHYLGEKVKPPISPKEALAAGGHGEADAIDANNNANTSDFNLQGDEGKASSDQSSSNEQLLGTEYADAEAIQALQTNELLPPSDGGENASGSEDNNNSANDNNSQQGTDPEQLITPDTMLESIIELLNNGGSIANSNRSPAQSQSQGQQDPNAKHNQRPSRRSMRMRAPNANNNKVEQQGNLSGLQVDAERYDAVIVTFLLDQLMLAHRQNSVFTEAANEVLKRYAEQPALIEQHPLRPLIDRIVTQLKKRQDKTILDFAPLTFTLSDEPTQLQLVNNYQGNTNTLVINAQNPDWSHNLQQQSEHKIALLLRPYPGLYGGQTMEIPADALIMLHPDERNRPQLRWRPVVISDIWLQDPAIGFIRAAIVNDKLIVDPQTQQTQINKVLVPEPHKPENQQSQFNTQRIYLSLFVVLLMLMTLGWLGQKGRQSLRHA